MEYIFFSYGIRLQYLVGWVNAICFLGSSSSDKTEGNKKLTQFLSQPILNSPLYDTPILLHFILTTLYYFIVINYHRMISLI